MSGLMKILRNSPTYTSTCESFLNFLAFFLEGFFTNTKIETIEQDP